MATSRLFVRNLPVNLTDAEFRSHFSQQHPVTDVKLIPHRRIGYIGYKTPEEAQDASKYFNKTFIRMSRLQVELARPPSEMAHPTAQVERVGWGWKDGEGKLREGGKKVTSLDGLGKRKRSDSNQEPALEAGEKDEKMKEFLEVMQKPSTRKTWMAEGAEAGLIQATQQKDRKRLRETEVQSEEDEQWSKKRRNGMDSQGAEGARAGAANDDMLPAKGESVGDTILGDDDWLKSKTGELLGPVEEEEELESPRALEPVEDDESTSGAEKIQDKPQSISEKPASDLEKPESPQKEYEDEAIKRLRQSKRLFLHNLPYTTAEEEVAAEFARFGPLEEVHLCVDSKTGSFRGLAFILYMDVDSAIKAYTAMNGAIFQGRLLQIEPATPKRDPKLDEFTIAKLPLKQQQQIKRKANASTASFNWNSLYMNPDAVMSSIASRLGAQKSELYDPTSTNAAAKQTQAETHIILETKKYFAENGVDLEAFKSKKRGDTAILVKNFPFGTTLDELRTLFEQYGRITRLLMPPTGTIAIVEFAIAPEAKAAFKGLAYRRLNGSILFLEPAPKDLFTSPATAQALSGMACADTAIAPKISAADLLQSERELENSETTTLHVRNLNFSTTSEKLAELFSPVAGFVSAVVRTRFDPKKNEELSRGYGFLEFKNKEQALAAMSAMNGYALEGHKIDVRLSQKVMDAGEQRRKDDRAKALISRRTKIIIKNLAFEASKADIRELAKQYGSIRSVRLPRKYDNSLRGFAFVEFSTALEAQQAYDALRHSHYHGRKLVIDFAAAETEDAEAQLEAMSAKVNMQVNKLAAQNLIGAGRKKFNAAGEDPEP